MAIDSTPSRRLAQKAARFAAPGSRQDIPTVAISHARSAPDLESGMRLLLPDVTQPLPALAQLLARRGRPCARGLLGMNARCSRARAEMPGQRSDRRILKRV